MLNFHTSFSCLSGLVSKIPWKLNKTRKANVRERLKIVDSVVSKLIQSGISFQNLDKYHQLVTPSQKYFVPMRLTKKHPKAMKGVHLIPHFTKLPRDFEKFHER